MIGQKAAWFEAERPVETRLYERERLQAGHEFRGPAVVFQYDTTTVIPPGWVARVDLWGNLLIARPD